MHQNSRLLFENYAKKYFGSGMRVLEIGPDKFPSSYQTMVGNNAIEWHTLDLSENPHLTYMAAEEYSFPISDSTYDIVLSGQVVEHVRRPWIWIKEVTRVCREGGLVIIASTVESFEVPTYRRYIPGRSPEWQGWKWRVTNQLLGRLGFPVERAYDTITVGKKTGRRAF